MTKENTQQENSWFVYMLRCADDTLYTGIAKDVANRVEQHNNDNIKGAKYTRARRPVALVYSEVCDSRSSASKREYELKQLSRAEKLHLIG